MEEEYKIAELIQRYLSGEATIEEIEQVKMWERKSARHREMMEAFRQDGYLEIQIAEHDVFDREKGFRRFLTSKKIVDRRRWLRQLAVVAAIMIVMLSVVTWEWQSRKKSEIPVLANMTAPILPGSSKAILILGDGKQLDLSDSTRMELQDHAAKIVVEGDCTLYFSNHAVLDTVLHTIITPVGGEYSLIFSDGTRVWLNAGSHLRFPAVFSDDQREVELEGEAYFEVVKDSLRPFLVKTGETVVKVLGTSFNVKAYTGEVLRTTLVSGRVAVKYEGEEIKILPGEQWILEKGRPRVEKVNAERVVGWVKGNFAFDDVDLPDVFKILERWYDVHVFVANVNVNAMKFTGVFPRYADIDRVLDIIGLATCTRLEIKDRTIMVYAD